MPVSPSYTTALTLGADVDQSNFRDWMAAVEQLVNDNETAVAANITDIAANLASIVANDTDIASNAASAATNSADVATNAADIATNAADIATNAAAVLSQVSGAEITAATETALRAYSPADIKSFIDTHGGGGGGGLYSTGDSEVAIAIGDFLSYIDTSDSDNPKKVKFENAVPFQLGAEVVQTSTQSLGSGSSPVELDWDATNFEDGEWWDAANPERLTVPADVDSVILSGFGYFNAAAGTAPYIKVEHFNSSSVSQGFRLYVAQNGGSFGAFVSGRTSVSSGDYFVMSLRHNAGAVRTTNATLDSFFSISKVN